MTDHVCAEKTPANITLAAIHLAKTMSGETTVDSIDEDVLVLETARRMVVVWTRAVHAHDKGEFNFAVRSHPLVSRQILTAVARKRIEEAYGMDLSDEINKNIEATNNNMAAPRDRRPPGHHRHPNNIQLHRVDPTPCISKHPLDTRT